jgi:nucleoside-diphosphate-sugar epimerase
MSATPIDAVLRDVKGAFNVAADPVLGPSELGRLLGARPVTVPPAGVRALLTATWRTRLQASEPGWLDLALGVPVMDITRARRELEWTPRISALDAVAELLDGMPEGAHEPTPAMRG